MFGRIKRAMKIVATALSIIVAVLPTLLGPEMRSLYSSLVS